MLVGFADFNYDEAKKTEVDETKNVYFFINLFSIQTNDHIYFYLCRFLNIIKNIDLMSHSRIKIVKAY